MPSRRFLGALVVLCATISVGCRRDEPPTAEPVAPVAERPPAPRGLSDRQKSALERIEATGAGVERDESGFPVRIDLASDRVFADEDLVRDVLEFPRLKSLRLAVSSLSEETLSRLVALAQLEELLLQDAPLDDAGLASLLDAMPKLKRLTLRRLNGVTDSSLEAIARCERLEVLALIEMNRLTGTGLAQLLRMKKLRSLDLRNCGGLAVADLGQLASLEGLVELKLGGAAINDRVAEIVVDFPALHSLTIEDAEISAAFLDQLAQSPLAGRLRVLAFARCYGVTDDALKSLGAFSNLETVALRDVPITGAFLGGLSGSKSGPLSWKTLIATNAYLDDDAIGHLPQVAPELKRLDLRGNINVTDESRAAFDDLDHLQEIELEGTGVTANGQL